MPPKNHNHRTPNFNGIRTINLIRLNQLSANLTGNWSNETTASQSRTSKASALHPTLRRWKRDLSATTNRQHDALPPPTLCRWLGDFWLFVAATPTRGRCRPRDGVRSCCCSSPVSGPPTRGRWSRDAHRVELESTPFDMAAQIGMPQKFTESVELHSYRMVQ